MRHIRNLTRESIGEICYRQLVIVDLEGIGVAGIGAYFESEKMYYVGIGIVENSNKCFSQSITIILNPKF